MTALTAGTSKTFTLRDTGSVTISTSGGIASVLATPTGGTAQTTILGPTPSRLVVGPFAEGATVVVTNQSATLDYDQPYGSLVTLNDAGTSLVTGDGTIVSTKANTVFADTAYSGTSNNATTHLQALIDAASAAYSTSTGRIRVVVPSGVWMVDGLVWKSNVWYDWGDAVIRKRSDGAPPYNRIIGTVWPRVETLGTYYGQADNIKSTGGRFETNSIQCPNGIFVLDEGRNCELMGFTVVHSAGVADWAVQVSGRNIEIGGGWAVLGGSELYQDGLHIKYGKGINVVGGYSESGDDALAFGWDIVDISQDYDDEALEDVTVVGTVVKSSHGSGVKVYYGVDTAGIGGTNRRRVKRLTVTGITGSSGTNRNNGIAILDGTQARTDPTFIEDVKIEANLDIGGASHDGTSAYGIYVTTGTRIAIDANIRITDTTGGVTRFRPFYIQCADNLKIKLNQTGPTELASWMAPYAASTILRDVMIHDGDFMAGNVDAVSGVDIQNTQNGTMGGISFLNNNIRNIRDTSYAILAGSGANSIGDLRICGNRFYKRAGATTARAYATNSATAVSHVEISGNDFSDVFQGILSVFNANHVSYYVTNNRGCASKVGGTATITAAATTIAVTHAAGVRFATGTSASAPQISVVPTNAPTNAIKWSVSVTSDTVFAINSDIAPGASTATFAWSVDTSKKPVA